MKSVLISIQPKWCEKIASGEKTIEVRKSRPKIETPFKCYIYATKKEYLQHIFKKGEYIFCDDHSVGKFDENIFVKNKHDWQGKVIGEFVCDKFYLIKNQGSRFSVADEEQSVTNKIARESCLDYDDMVSYLGNKNGYGWHISDLVIYEKPKELSEFIKPCLYNNHCWQCEFISRYDGICTNFITRPPQSWCYVEE